MGTGAFVLLSVESGVYAVSGEFILTQQNKLNVPAKKSIIQVYSNISKK